MTALLRLPRALVDAIHVDLSRPHRFAAERVGFLFCRCVRLSAASWLSVGYDYAPVDDAAYVRDRRVGARIGAPAIRSVMQRVLDTGDGAFHVHRHDHPGGPRFSQVDLDGLTELIPPFAAVGPNVVHGGLVLSTDDASAIAWIDGAHAPIVGVTSIIGYPSSIRRVPDGF